MPSMACGTYTNHNNDIQKNINIGMNSISKEMELEEKEDYNLA